MFIHRISVRNALSFGPTRQTLTLNPLNVLIGPNGSGKSNLIEVVGLLQAAPTDLAAPIREGGGTGDWIWKGEPKASSATIDVIVNNPHGQQRLRFGFTFAERGQRFELIQEKIENEEPFAGYTDPYIYFEASGGKATLNYRDTEAKRRELQPEDIDVEQSILAQRKDPDHYPELTYLGKAFSKICLYREWFFGRYTPPRLPQKSDLPNDFLSENGKNLGLVLNRLSKDFKVKQKILNALHDLYDGVSDFHVNVEYGTVQVFMQEGTVTVPATRLSDGTLRYLCLLAILCNPDPPPLVCIEEPELGLHPDVIPVLADLLREASERCQLIVTTHSDTLIDALTETPESVVVCEKINQRTTLKRLDKSKLAHWLEKYRLGELWSTGEFGGNRW